MAEGLITRNRHDVNIGEIRPDFINRGVMTHKSRYPRGCQQQNVPNERGVRNQNADMWVREHIRYHAYHFIEGDL